MTFDFTELDARMQWYVDENILPCAETLVMRGTDIIHRSRHGYMDLESREPLRADAIYRIYSNTKIVTSVALMMLFEEGRFDLDDEVADLIPGLGDMSVLVPGADSIDQTRPAEEPIRIRHVLSHTAGLSYGFLEPFGVLDRAYQAAGLTLDATDLTLQTLCETLGELPLAYEPGTNWRYSYATDVCARLVEVLSGQSFDTFLDERIFTPLDMVDTGFWVPPEKIERLITMYAPHDMFDPMKPGLDLSDDPATGRYSRPRPFLSGGGGLVSTMDDYAMFIAMIVNGGTWNGTQIIGADTLELMRESQLAEGVKVNFTVWNMPDTVFGLGFAVKTAPRPDEPDAAIGEYHWGGMAGTHSWMSPDGELTGLAFTQRMPGFLHPFSHDVKRMVYAAATS